MEGGTTTKACRCCKRTNSPLGCFLFKTHSTFLNHAAACGFNNDPLLKNITQGPLAVCKECCKEILCADSKNNGTNIYVGYLTARQHRDYRGYARKSDKLHQTGFVVIKREVNMHLGFLMHVILQNQKNITPLVKGEGKPPDMNRMWVELNKKLGKEDQEELTKNRDKLGLELGKIINPDAFFAKLAQENRNALCNMGDVQEDAPMVKYEVTGEGVLYRSIKEKAKQVPHRDSHAHSYNVVEALTPDYSIVVFPHTHLLKMWDETNKPTVYGKGETVTLNDDQMMIMHANTIHCGGPSCGISNNFERCRKKMRKQYRELLKKRWLEKMLKKRADGKLLKKSEDGKLKKRGDGKLLKKSGDPVNEPPWFGKNPTNLEISDMSIHRTVDVSHGRSGSSEMVTGKTRIFSADHIPTIPKISVEEDIKYLDYLAAIKQGKCLYREASQQFWPYGNKVPLGHPCSGVINDAGISVEGLVMSATPPKGAATRRSMRFVEKEINCAKREEPDRNGLSYCTCPKCLKQKGKR